MNCLLAAATAKEISPFLNHYRNSDNKQDIDILITGIGLTAATYSFVKQFSLKKPALVIQAGIAGCFDKNISLGSVVITRQDTIADQIVTENKQLKTMFDLGLVKPNQAPYSKGWLVNPHRELIKKTKLKIVNAVSVNRVTTTTQMTGLYQKKFQPSIESMEGAALHYTCLLEKIPFLQIRSISNYIGERNKKKWNMKEAVSNLNYELTRILEQFRNP
jgi:futalosine hydrolase